MSLFEDESYIYRDTFFVYLEGENRPTTKAVADCFEKLGSKYDVGDSSRGRWPVWVSHGEVSPRFFRDGYCVRHLVRKSCRADS